MTLTPALSLRNAWLWCGWAFVVLVIFLSLNTEPVDVGRIDEVKAGHFLAYGWLVLWVSQGNSSLSARAAWAIGFSLMGVALEYAQGMTGYRTFAYADMRDNLLGAGMGLALCWTPLGNVLAAVESRFGKVRFRGAA
jgi:hypothetical protein